MAKSELATILEKLAVMDEELKYMRNGHRELTTFVDGRFQAMDSGLARMFDELIKRSDQQKKKVANWPSFYTR
jgi:hypothetical protein